MSTKTQTKQTATAAPEAPEQYCIMCGHKANDLVEHYSEDIETVKEGFAVYSKNAHKEMATLRAHAEKLAEALREIRNTIAANGGKNVSLDWIESKAGDALAQWEGAK